MDEEIGCFDPSNMQQHEGLIQAEDGFSQIHIPTFSLEEHLNCTQNHPTQQDVAAAVLEMEFQQQGETHLMQEIVNNSNWHNIDLLNDKYEALRSLVPTFPKKKKSVVPNPNEKDRASVVGNAIKYINEVKRTVNELKVLVEKKRCCKERLEREDDTMVGNIDTESLDDMKQPYNVSSLKCSWLQWKSKNTEVDIRIVDDEVTVKLVQQKRINSLLFVSKVHEELNLDLHHVAGGLIGDYYSFLFNSKICEGSIIHASAIANKLIEVVDKQYAPTSSY